MKNHVEFNHFNNSPLNEFGKSPNIISNTEEIIKLRDLEQIKLLEQELENFSQ